MSGTEGAQPTDGADAGGWSMPEINFSLSDVDWGKVDWFNLIVYDVLVKGAILFVLVKTVE